MVCLWKQHIGVANITIRNSRFEASFMCDHNSMFVNLQYLFAFQIPCAIYFGLSYDYLVQEVILILIEQPSLVES